MPSGLRRVPDAHSLQFITFSCYRRQKFLKTVEVMRYIHRNPVKRKLVPRAEDWQWNSFNGHASGSWCGVEIESEWTGRERERMGAPPRVPVRTLAHPVAQEQNPGDKGGA